MQKEKNNEEIEKRIGELLRSNDKKTWNYVCKCIYGKSYEEVLAENPEDVEQIQFSANSIQIWKEIGLLKLYNDPERSLYEKYVFVSNGVDNNYRNYYICRKFELENVDEIWSFYSIYDE